MNYSTITAVLLFIGLLGCTPAQENTPIPEEVVNKISDIAGNIPGLNNLNTSALPSVEEAENLFKRKCDKNGGPNAFDEAKRAQADLQHCVESLINTTVLLEEMEKHKPNGELDVVFKKYCRKTPIFRQCISNFTKSLEPCLEETERTNKDIVMNITDSLLGFLCYKEGDRIALFIAAGGPECFKSKQEVLINKCANTSLGNYLPMPDPSSGGLPTLENLPNLIFGAKECNMMSNLQKCMVDELETCDDPTPGNVVDSIFKFIRRVTPCDGFENAQNARVVGERSSAAANILSSIFTTIFVIGFMRFI